MLKINNSLRMYKDRCICLGVCMGVERRVQNKTNKKEQVSSGSFDHPLFSREFFRI